MNKTLKVTGFVILALSLKYGLAHGACSGNGNGGTCNTDPSVGPQGPAGQNGSNGTNGSNGVNGNNGVNGKDGSDAQIDKAAKLVLDTAVRLYDGKYIQLQAFNSYALARHDAHDIGEEFQNSHNDAFGARIVFKLGSSYEERLLAAQKRQIEALEALVSRMAN